MKKLILMLLSVIICGTANAQLRKENPILIGQERSFTVSKAKLNSDPVLRMPEANKDYHITSYTVSYVSKEKESDLLGPFLIQGNDMKKGNAALILRRAQPGDRIFFEDITAVSNDVNKQPLTLTAAIKIQ
jgi:hypothetical protein